MLERALRLADRKPHEVLVARKESFAHGLDLEGRDVRRNSTASEHIIITKRAELPPARSRHRRLPGSRLAALLACLLVLATAGFGNAGDGSARAAPNNPARSRPQAAESPRFPKTDRIVVGYRSSAEETPTRVVDLPPAASMTATLARLRAERGVLWAVPDYVAHATGAVVPNDPGTTKVAGGWRELQWNLDGPFGVRAPEAWANAAAAGAPAGSKAIV
ncbi:MAG TPA: hypothetical protein VFL90_11050, partial [Methylomirabilota bacterium]|nr:hypothetical protein [Methylomirabilota bacterium]